MHEYFAKHFKALDISTLMNQKIMMQNREISNEENDDINAKQIDEEIFKLQEEEMWKKVRATYNTYSEHPDKVNVNSLWQTLKKTLSKV